MNIIQGLNSTSDSSYRTIKKMSVILFIVYIILYFLVYGFYGYNDADDGYTLALSWRIFNGEIPYRDFILVRPPLSPILHTITLFVIPENYQVIFERFVFYLEIGIYSLLSALIIDHIYSLRSLNLNLYLLATIGFVLSVTTYTPMPWHSVDALLFSTIGIYLLVRYPSPFGIVLGVTALFLSALCKQPFYLMPFAGLAYVLLVYKDRKKSIIAVSALLLLLILFFLTLRHYQILHSFARLTTGSTTLKDLIRAGLVRYLNVTSYNIILPVFLWIFIRCSPLAKRLRLDTSAVLYFFIALTLIYPVFYFYPFIRFISQFRRTPFFQDELAILLFLISICLLIINFRNNKKWITLSLLLLLAWSCGISWGDQTPAFFSTVLIFSFYLVAHQYFSVKNLLPLALATLAISTVVYFIGYQKPIYSAPRSQLKYEMTDLFPKLSFIKVSKDRYDKYRELKLLIEKHGRNFKTLPGMPLTNYLANTNSPISIDWPFNAETNNDNVSIIQGLVKKKPVVFLEKKPEFVSVDSSTNRTNSSVAFFVKANWQKVDSTLYFDVYKMDTNSQ